MATYNGEKFIAEQIDSILNQTYQNWKLIIHDDGSDDGTVDIVKKYVEKHPDKFHFINDGIRCGGAFENFNHLLQSIDGNFDYLMFGDQDDVWLSRKIEMLLDEIKKQEHLYQQMPIVVFSDAIVVDEHLSVIHPSLMVYTKRNPQVAKSYRALVLSNVVSGFTMILNKLAFDISLPIPNITFPHDWWIVLITAKKGRNFFLSKAPVLYRRHGDNVTDIRNSKQIVVWKIMKIFWEFPLLFQHYARAKEFSNALGEDMTFFDFIKGYALRYLVFGRKQPLRDK